MYGTCPTAAGAGAAPHCILAVWVTGTVGQYERADIGADEAAIISRKAVRSYGY